MNKSLLTLYLQRVKGGDEAYLDKLLSQLAERLLYVPTESDPSESGEGVSVKIIRTIEAHRTLVPVFTSETLLKTWTTENNLPSYSISLLGADLASALRADSWFVINPSSDTAVELQPFMVERLMRIDENPEPLSPEPLVELPVNLEVIDVGPENAETIIAELPEPKMAEVPVSSSTSEEPPKRKGSFLNFLKSQP